MSHGGLERTIRHYCHCRKLERRASRSASDASAWKHQRRDYRKLVTQKREAFWRNLIAQQSPTPRRMWQSIDNLLGRGRLPADVDISATDFYCFYRKVADIHATTSCAADPVFIDTDFTFPDFAAVSADEVAAAVLKLPNKQCSSDPLPPWLLKECVGNLGPFLSHLFCQSLQQGIVPAAFKSNYICRLLKKPGLDSADVKNYRLISNLKVISKLLERLVASQLMEYRIQDIIPPDIIPPDRISL